MELERSESPTIEGDIEEFFGFFSSVELEPEQSKSKSKQGELEQEFDLFSNVGEIIVDAVDLKLDDNGAPVDLQSLEKYYKNKIGLLTKDNYKRLKRPLVVALHKFNDNLLKHRKWIDLFVELSNLYFLSRQIGFFVADTSDISLFYPDAFCFSLDYEPLGPIIFAVDRLERQFEYTGSRIDILKECPERNQFKISGEYGTRLMNFLRRFHKNQLFFSEPLPVETEMSCKPTKVKVAVAENFDELVENAERDVLIVFHVDWCPFSQMLIPTLDELSLLLADDEENLSIVKINSELNYIPIKYCVSCYPTIMFLRKNDKKNPIRLRGSYSIEGLIQFISKNSTVELKHYDRNGNKRDI